MKKINFDKLWKDFDKWYDDHVWGISWGYQKMKIQSLVEAQLKPKKPSWAKEKK